MQYEKAASVLSSHDPAIVLAKVDANAEENKELAGKYEVQGFPTLKIFRNNGEKIQEYNGPRDADGIVTYLMKQVGPASNEIKTAEDVKSHIDDKKIFVVCIRQNKMSYIISINENLKLKLMRHHCR